MCEKTVENEPEALWHVPDQHKTQWMCQKAVEEGSYNLKFVPDYFKTQRMCDDVVRNYPFSLQFVPDWFVTQQQIKIWHDSDDWHDDNEIIEWYKGYKKRKAQKASIKKELMPIAWHLSRWWDWCMPEDEKQETEKLWE